MELKIIPGQATAETMTATEAKQRFSLVLEKAIHGKVVAITKQKKVRAVVLSVEEYRRLIEQQSDPLVEMRGEFDSLLARMQAPAAAKAGHELFDADAGALGKAALKGVRRKRS